MKTTYPSKKLPSYYRTAGGKRTKDQVDASIHLPYSTMVSPSILSLRGGAVMSTIKIEGYKFETAGDDVLAAKADMLNNLLLTNAKSQVGLWFHVIRRRVAIPQMTGFKSEYAKTLNKEWAAKLRESDLFVNEGYLTVVRFGGTGLINVARDAFNQLLGNFDRTEKNIEQQKKIAEIDEFIEEALITLSDYNARRLTTFVDDNDNVICEPLNFLSYLVNHQQTNIGDLTGPFDNALPTKYTFWRNGKGLIRDGSSNSGYHLRVASIKSYSSKTSLTGMAGVLGLPFEFVLSQNFVYIDYGAAMRSFALHGRRLAQEMDGSSSVLDVKDAIDEIQSGQVAMGFHSLVMTTYSSNSQQADNDIAAAESAIRHARVVTVTEGLGAEPAYWSMFPGNFRYIARSSPIKTTNMARFNSFHNMPIGQASNNHWGQSVSVIKTTGNTPYFINLHVDDVGLTTITGDTGGGKTTLLTFLIAQMDKFGGRRFLFDMDRACEPFVRAMGGTYHRQGINPLQMQDTKENRALLFDVFKVMLNKTGIEKFSSEDLAAIKLAVDGNFKLEKQQRHLDIVASFFGPEASDGLRAALKPWLSDGIYGWVFQGDDDISFDESITGFDISQWLKHDVIKTPLLFYLMSRIKQTFDGTRFAIFLEEGARLLSDPLFEPIIRDLELDTRKKNGLVVFITQDPKLILNNPVGELIYKMSPTQIYFPNDSARAEDYVDKLGLSQKQYELIKTTPRGSRTFLLRHNNEAILARLDLKGLEHHIVVLSGRNETIRLMDQLIEEHGEEPSKWLHHYQKEAQRLDV